MKRLELGWAVAAAIAACTPYDPNLGTTPFLCGPQSPPCPDGFTCEDQSGQMVCANKSAGSGSGSGGSGGFPCVDNGNFDPGGSTATAFQTPVASGRSSITYGPVALCPGGIRQTYAVEITEEGQTLKSTITYQADGDPLNVLLLNTSGQTVATGSANGNPDSDAASVPTEPSGTAYVQVVGPATPGSADGENNYLLNITVSGP
jgi:hypothetical protein